MVTFVLDSALLSNSGPAQVGQLLATPGVTEGLVRLLQHRDDTALASEAAWVMTYLTAASEGHLERLVQAGLVPPLVERLTGETCIVRKPTTLQECLQECSQAPSCCGSYGRYYVGVSIPGPPARQCALTGRLRADEPCLQRLCLTRRLQRLPIGLC